MINQSEAFGWPFFNFGLGFDQGRNQRNEGNGQKWSNGGRNCSHGNRNATNTGAQAPAAPVVIAGTSNMTSNSTRKT